ncbi:MAG: rRNA pseudouridine synthase [Firmicutes bacterium]|nr:rRNA pseudouridine synthase [Bacillota bacterium]
MRINKYLALCGLGSRRGVEELILQGKVQINGKIVKELSKDIQVENDTVVVEGRRLEVRDKHLYLMLHKPKGCVCTNKDEKGRKTVFDILDDKYESHRLFCVGRLDYETEGLLLLTTDGDMANRLMHPQFEISKTYVAKIEGEIANIDLDKIRTGVMIDGQKTKKCRARVIGKEEKSVVDRDGNKSKKELSRIEVIISEGRNRQVRKMFESINREVVFLTRKAIGDIKLGGLERGRSRELREQEIAYLKKV